MNASCRIAKDATFNDPAYMFANSGHNVFKGLWFLDADTTTPRDNIGNTLNYMPKMVNGTPAPVWNGASQRYEIQPGQSFKVEMENYLGFGQLEAVRGFTFILNFKLMPGTLLAGDHLIA